MIPSHSLRVQYVIKLYSYHYAIKYVGIFLDCMHVTNPRRDIIWLSNQFIFNLIEKNSLSTNENTCKKFRVDTLCVFVCVCVWVSEREREREWPFFLNWSRTREGEKNKCFNNLRTCPQRTTRFYLIILGF